MGNGHQVGVGWRGLQGGGGQPLRQELLIFCSTESKSLVLIHPGGLVQWAPLVIFQNDTFS